ncbi:hypothetical protein [Streptomyces aureoversilis]|uniref:YCII-related domain-containing protein n=1 Tax=Streptomyces aureoversilis TaxID=67277 RepID=A0ABW0ACT1_9ACTN
MYLVHVGLRRPRRSTELPAEIRELVLARALSRERIEHISVHPQARPHPVLGVYLLADRLEEAEEHAEQACRRAIAHCPQLARWEVVDAQVPLLDVRVASSAGSLD